MLHNYRHMPAHPVALTRYVQLVSLELQMSRTLVAPYVPSHTHDRGAGVRPGREGSVDKSARL
jgi:hypothetical protein